MKKHIINVSDLSPTWNWLESEFNDQDLTWHHYSSQKKIPEFLPKYQ